MYQLYENGVIRLSDLACIPMDEGNRDYIEYLLWVADGNAPMSSTPTTLEQRRADIDAQRDEKLQDGVTWNGKLWHADPYFQTQITGLVSAFEAGILPAGTLVNVRAKDNTINALGLTELKQLAGAVLQYVQSVYAWSWADKDALQ